ncbi:hypothetical protein ALI22I_33445 [Saccharothrix sp. ALI-22-I]|uniref:protein DpdD n=1 Tax=Saccharothrix sp. ALI-22-I TaxID=1933778 RepID=UPI00097BC078|nr:protein DpdD [Saccharothrix sp. ALI-22-I]ONI83420.1 hypothetical protein ALI22I_33445 [Saccharothrix sp. ALI-22-I]
MTAAETLLDCVGDPARFGVLRERVELLVDEQARTWVGGNSGWLIVPLNRSPQGFYLLSEDREGQRRGREVLEAFLGPAVSVTSSTPAPESQRVDRLLELEGLTHMSRVARIASTAQDMLERLEDAVATMKGKDARLRPVRPSHVDLLRDLRLALLQRDGRLADRLLGDLRFTGRLSAENLRFLTVEMLGRLHRWRELADLPHVGELLRARRPRVVNEVLLEMVWHTEVADLVNAGLSPRAIYAQIDLGARYGSLVSAVEVPSTAAGRGVGLIAASALGDLERVQRLVTAAEDELERSLLNRLIALEPTAAAGDVRAGVDVRDLHAQGRYGAFIRAFLDSPEPSIADLAVQATLDSDDFTHAPDVLDIVDRFKADGRLRLDRRLQRDLEDLGRLVNGSCGGWQEWCERLARSIRWSDASKVARAQYDQWEVPSALSTEDSKASADALLEAWGGVNQDQVIASLDVLCRSVAAGGGGSGDLREAVLLVLAEQENLSSPVRNAYLLLLEHVLESGPGESTYRSVVELTANLWRRVAAPASVDWGIALVEIVLNAPTPDADVRLAVTADVLTRVHDFQQRLSIRQLSELTALGEECGIPTHFVERASDETESPWRRLDGKTIGVYSLLTGAAHSLDRRLSALCTPRSIEANSDTVATPGLRSLAARVDYLIVDTWHASHSATNGIDAVRPRDRQLFPTGRGVSAFLQALEHVLTSEGTR